jgi:hypothetical protein
MYYNHSDIDKLLERNKVSSIQNRNNFWF